MDTWNTNTLITPPMQDSLATPCVRSYVEYMTGFVLHVDVQVVIVYQTV